MLDNWPKWDWDRTIYQVTNTLKAAENMISVYGAKILKFSVWIARGLEDMEEDRHYYTCCPRTKIWKCSYAIQTLFCGLGDILKSFKMGTDMIWCVFYNNV
jgi:hypothetical protein